MELTKGILIAAQEIIEEMKASGAEEVTIPKNAAIFIVLTQLLCVTGIIWFGG
jgi:hypothetical protein